MAGHLKIPFDFPQKDFLKNRIIHVLAGDLGGTKTNLALYRARVDGIEIVAETRYHSPDYKSGTDILLKFIQDHQHQRPDRICLGVAGPVFQGRVELTNLSWILDSEEIKKATAIQEVALINDLEATAYGLAALDEGDFLTIHPGQVEIAGNMAILAPGTGLGEGGLYWNGVSYHPFATEGGHTDFSPRNKIDLKLLDFLGKKYEVVSWERVIAGPAIYDIYQFLRDVKKRKEPAWLRDALHKEDPSALISQLAIEEKNAVCIETMQIFVRLIARESSNLVLKLKATGGLFLGGGIPPKISSLLQQNNFYHNFLDCDRMEHLLKKVPVRIILNPKTALLGAAWFGAYGRAE